MASSPSTHTAPSRGPVVGLAALSGSKSCRACAPTLTARRQATGRHAPRARRASPRASASTGGGTTVGGELKICEAGNRLKGWIIMNGGVVHPDLEVVEVSPSTGSRGMVCTGEISEEEIAGKPLVLVPESLYLTSQVARVGFEYYEQQGAAPLGELDMPTQLAMLLAHEKLQGPDSFYEPYIACLPARPPNAWALSDAELDAALAALQCDVTPDWREDAVKTRSLLETHAQGVEDRYKAYFPVTAETFFWAMGHVLSRSFASHPQLGLAPFIDLINHDASASHPELAWDEDEAEDEREYFYYVTSSQGGKARALSTGEELYIRYIEDSTAPKEAFMSYGFVPPELLR